VIQGSNCAALEVEQRNGRAIDPALIRYLHSRCYSLMPFLPIKKFVAMYEQGAVQRATVPLSKFKSSMVQHC
jgi:hypothetical protein